MKIDIRSVLILLATSLSVYSSEKPKEKLMEKIVPQKAVLFTRHELKSPADIPVHAEKDIPALEKIAKENGLEVAGPIENAYWNMAIKGVPHILEIWLPVKKKEGVNLKDYKIVEPYKCLTMEFKDSIDLIGDAWGAFGKLAEEKKVKSTAHDREVYWDFDFEKSLNHRMELQMGIQ